METLFGLAEQIRNGHVSPPQLLDQAIEKYENKKAINAIVVTNLAAARERAQRADKEVITHYLGPLHGIPISIKDTFATAHIATSYGMPFLYRPRQSAEAVKRLEHAGAIIFGKTNLPAMSYDWQSKHPRYGLTLHPENGDFSPGGSSGGSAAAVAAGIVPIEVGSDIAGSLRLPAGLCGVTTIRPTEGAISLDGHMAVPMSRPLSNLLTAGPMANNIQDLKFVYSLLSDLKPRSSLSPLKKVGFFSDFPETRISSEVQRVLENTKAQLQRNGIEATDFQTDIDYREVLDLWGHISGYELQRASPLYTPRFLKPVFISFFEKRYGKHRFSAASGAGMAMSKKAYHNTLKRRKELIEQFDKELADFDTLITPVSGIDGIPHGKTGSEFDVDGVQVPYAEPFAMLHCATACFGHPIVVINAGRSERGLPIGTQLHSRRNTDHQLLDFAGEIEMILSSATTPQKRESYASD